MPTEITRASAPVIGHSRVREINPLGISPLAAAATVLFVVLHLVSGVMLERSHARPAIEPAALAALDDEAKCPAEPRRREPSLPNDWSLGAD
jgi:hypothetical protein